MIVSEQNEVELGEGEELVDLNEEATSLEEQVVEDLVTEEEPSYAIPDKFKDKSIEDVAKSYQELESEFGRKSGEIGELRKLTDELLQLQLQEKQETTPQKKEVDVDSLLENPTEAINEAVNARFEALEGKLTQDTRDKGKVSFEGKHPDWQTLMQDPTFTDWVGGNKVRLQMFQEANSNYDYDTADELFSMYKELHGGKQEEAQEAATQKRTQKLKAAKTEKGSGGAKSSKIYSRKALMHQRIHERAKYEANEETYMKAYAEGRVR